MGSLKESALFLNGNTYMFLTGRDDSCTVIEMMTKRNHQKGSFDGTGALLGRWKAGSRHILHVYTGFNLSFSSVISSLGLVASGTVDSSHSFTLLWFQPQPALR